MAETGMLQLRGKDTERCRKNSVKMSNFSLGCLFNSLGAAGVYRLALYLVR